MRLSRIRVNAANVVAKGSSELSNNILCGTYPHILASSSYLREDIIICWCMYKLFMLICYMDDAYGQAVPALLTHQMPLPIYSASKYVECPVTYRIDALHENTGTKGKCIDMLLLCKRGLKIGRDKNTA